MDAIPLISTVAELQRNYRPLVNKLKKTNGVMVVVNNGKPDVIMMDPETYNTRAKRLKELEEENLLKIGAEAMEEYRQGKTISLGNRRLIDLIK